MSDFIQQALVFITAAVLLVPLFKRLGFGSVLGYLIAGISVGPFGLAFIKDAESILHFAELGVVFLLFLIGLEIQPRKLWSMKKNLIGLGGFQVLISTLLFSTIAYSFDMSLMAAIVLGFALSLSSTAFVLQTLIESNRLNTEHGQSSFSILLMQDLLAIPALAIIPALGSSASTEAPSFLQVAKGLLLILFLILASRYLMRPLFRQIASARSREVFTAATLFIVLGVAALMQEVGLSAALGAFIAGVLLADSEYRHELEANLEPFKSLLMGLFFIAVGMGVNLDIIGNQPFTVVLITLAYMMIKFVIVFGLSKILKMGNQSSKLTALTVAQGGEFAFVIFGIILHFQLLASEIIQFLTVVITLSMAMSPLLNLLDERLTGLKRKNAEPEYDKIQNESPEVIIAGFGRFGQIFGRILKAQNIPFVAIDHDSDHIELVRRFGNKVYYGDASRVDILEAAGAAQAKFFILAVDDVTSSLKTVESIKEHFPHLKVFARARNRGHAFDLMEHDIPYIKRETFDSSLNLAHELLNELGFQPKVAENIVERFRQHDLIMLKNQFEVRNDDKMFISVSNQGASQLEQVLGEDSRQTHIQ